MKTKVDIAVGDIIKLKTIQDYREAGDEITELVEMFAGQYCRVENLEEEVNEFGERTYIVSAQHIGLVSVTDHEIAELYKKVDIE